MQTSLISGCSVFKLQDTAGTPGSAIKWSCLSTACVVDVRALSCIELYNRFQKHVDHCTLQLHFVVVIVSMCSRTIC
jgi:hypothetical protein